MGVALLAGYQRRSSRIAFAQSDLFVCRSVWPVSYTHLDVYKRQAMLLVENGEDSFTAVSVTAADGAVKIETL